MKRELLGLCLLMTALSQYQERCVYYNERLNVCAGGVQDTIAYRVSIDGEIYSKVSITHLQCHQLMPLYIFQIDLPPRYTFYFKDSRGDYNAIPILEESRRSNSVGYIHLYQKSRIQNPITFRGKSFHCEIKGTGKIEPFGDVPFNIFCVEETKTAKEI